MCLFCIHQGPRFTNIFWGEGLGQFGMMTCQIFNGGAAAKEPYVLRRTKDVRRLNRDKLKWGVVFLR